MHRWLSTLGNAEQGNLPLNVILGGRYELTLIGWLTKEAAPEKLQTSHDYYASLQRRTDQSYLERFATFSAVADQLILAPVDWTDAMIEDPGALSALGVRQETEEPNEWDDDAQTLARVLMLPGILDARWIHYITSGIRHGEGNRRVFAHLSARLACRSPLQRTALRPMKI